MSFPELEKLTSSIRKLEIPVGYRHFITGLPRVINKKMCNDYIGHVMLHFLSNIPSTHTFQLPISKYHKDKLDCQCKNNNCILFRTR